VAETATLGPYGVTLDARGVRLSREGEQRVSAMGAGLRAILNFTLAESGQAPVPFRFERMEIDAEGNIEIHGAVGQAVALYATLRHKPELEGMELDIKAINATEEMTVRLGVHMDLVGQADPRWLIPGMFYNENRVRDCQRIYPSWSEIQRDPARFVANHWNFRSDRASMPVVFCMTYVLTAFMFTEEVFGLSDDRPRGQGIAAIGMGAEEGYPQISVHAPYLEDPVKFSYCHEHKTQSEETFVRLDKNEPLRLRVILGFRPYKEDEPQVWNPIFRELQQELWMNHAQRPRLSSIEAERLALKGLTRWHLDEKAGMIHETSAFDKHYGRQGHNYERTHMHCGWMSGALPAYALLWNGRDSLNGEFVQAATTVLDKMTSELAPCGTLWPLLSAEDGFLPGLGPEDGLAHSRTVAEAVLFLLRSFRLELAANTAHKQWFDAVRSNLNFILSKQREDGALPAYWYVDDGEVFSHAGAAGMCWIAALAAFNTTVSSDVYRKAALRAGEYYAEFVENDFIYGCVEDLPLVPTVDDCHWAVIAYMHLYEADRNERWLRLAQRAANLAATWRMTYNTRFQTFTMLAKAEFQTRGGDISSAAAPTLVPSGLVSLGEMRKLSALTGDKYFDQRALEGRLYATQLLARVDGEFNARGGHAIHQVFHTDWWQPKGMVLSVGHAITCGLVLYAEMIERTMSIPVAAMGGDRESILEAASRSGITLRETNVVMPESAAARRQRDTRGDWEAEEQSYDTPAESLAAGNLGQVRHRPPTRIIGSAPKPVNLTPLPWESESSELPKFLTGKSSTPLQTPAPSPKEMPRKLDDMPRRQFARQSSSDVPPIAKGGAWDILAADTPPTGATPRPLPSGANRTPPPMDKPRPGGGPSKTPPPADRPSATRLGRHTPLSDDDPEGTALGSKLLSRPLFGGGEAEPPSPPQRPSGARKKDDSGGLPPPPPELSGGLLANLFDDPAPKAGVTPLRFEEQDEPAPPRFSLDERASASSASVPKEEPEAEGEADIKWKIF